MESLLVYCVRRLTISPLHLQSFSTSPFNMVLYPMNGRLLMSFLYTRKAGRIVWKIIDLFHCYHWSQKYVLERCVLARVRDHLYHFISPAQHGFLPGRSCVTQLLTALDQIGDHLDTDKQTDVIYLDMSKAFDKVCHPLLLRKLKQCNVFGRLLDWFNAYLTNRKQRVTVSGETSTEVLVSSGVPQGSLLGPLLFLLFVNNLPDRCSSSNVACFADDTKIYKLIDSVDDSKALQSDLDSLMDWSTSTFLPFNRQKM